MGRASVLGLLLVAACSSGGRIPDPPCCGTASHPSPTVGAVGEGEDWSQPALGDELGPAAVDVRGTIARYRAQGHSWGRIADLLNAGGVPTPSGRGHWHRASVQHYADPEGWAAEQAARRARRGRP